MVNAPTTAPAPAIAPISPAAYARQVSRPAEQSYTAPTSVADQTSYGFLYVGKRVLAYVLDTAANLGLCVGTLWFALIKQNLNPASLISADTVLPFVLFLIGFNWAIITAQEVAFGTSLGKRMFGLVLHGNAVALFLRAFFFLPSLGFAGLGLLWAVVDRRRRCWHDLVVDAQPSELARL